MAEYLHGAYGQQEASGISVPAKAGTLPVYFGVAPVHQLTDYTGTVKTPVVPRRPGRRSAMRPTGTCFRLARPFTCTL